MECFLSDSERMPDRARRKSAPRAPVRAVATPFRRFAARVMAWWLISCHVQPAVAWAASGANEPGNARPVDAPIPALVAVDEQINGIKHELDVQLRRMSQIQEQLDQLRALVRQLAAPTKPEDVDR